MFIPTSSFHLKHQESNRQNDVAASPTAVGEMAAPELLVPRLGERLVEQGFITHEALAQALAEQAQQNREGRHVLLGQLLVAMGVIDRPTLDRAVTQQILGLKEALEASNRDLESRVDQRTSELETALTRLAELNQIKANFMATVSHEFRTPLFHLSGNLELLLDGALGPLTAAQSEALAVMGRANVRLTELIENLLQFSNAAQQGIDLELARIRLNQPVKMAIDQMLPRALARDIGMECQLATEVPPVKADSRRITWVVRQLLDNAIKFSSPGRRVSVTTMADERDVAVAVTDAGIGIPADRLTEVFEPFHQLDASITRDYGGTGLGLALAQRIIEAHGSKIRVFSERGLGARFTFSLPVAAL